MLTLDRQAQPLALREERPLGPALLGGVLFTCLELVPLTAPGPATPLRALGALGLLAMAVALFAVGRPRVRSRPLPARPGVAPDHLELGGDELPPTYRATLVLQDASRHTVLEATDPARVLDDAAHLGRELGVPLGAGWGLGPPALDELVRTAPAGGKRFGPDDTVTLEHPPLPGQLPAAYTTLWASAFVLVASFVMSDGPERKGLVPSTLSVVLPCLGALILLVIGLWLLGLRDRVTLTPNGVTRLRFWFGRELAPGESRAVRVLGAALVRPGARHDGHLLVASDAGLFALPAQAPAGARVLGGGAAPVAQTGRAAE